ncbi:hypothetical protein HDU84_004085 [Entophlyctis sp. JEL0112]|nr:hypothetical protein HDU84_004085 [Entophlyctis sp. JEL0112]
MRTPPKPLLFRFRHQWDYQHAVPNAFMASRPRHEFWMVCARRMDAYARSRQQKTGDNTPFVSPSTVEEATGPVMLWNCLREYIRDKRIGESTVESKPWDDIHLLDAGVHHDNTASALAFNGFCITLPADELRDKVLTAIVKAILHSGANTPRTPREITTIIMQNGYAHLGGQTPHATISSRISMHFKRFNESKGRRVPLLGRVLSESNNRRIKYYVLQLPFVRDDDCSIVMQPEEPAKLARLGFAPPTAHQTRRGSSASIDLKDSLLRKRRNASVSSSRKKIRQKLTNPESDSDSIDTISNSPEIATVEELHVDESRFDCERLSLGPEPHMGEYVVEAESVTSRQRETASDVDDDSLSSEEESWNEGRETGEEISSQAVPPPQIPHQTYTFSPVFQPHIFIRPNTTSLPPLSTLHQQSISQLSPLLVSASPALNHQTHSIPTIGPVNRMLIPSPILLPSPRTLTVLSPQLGSGGSLSNIHPLDLGPGLYVSQHPNSNFAQIPHQPVMVANSITVKNPESISVGELDELLHEHDQSYKITSKLKKANEMSRNSQSLRYARRGTARQHNQNENGTKRATAAHRAPIASGVHRPHEKLSRTVELIKSPPNVSKVKQNISLRKCPFEFISVNLHITSDATNTTVRESGRIVTLSRFTRFPAVYIASHSLSAIGDDFNLKFLGSKLCHLSGCVRVGEIARAFPNLSASSTDSSTRFTAPWRKFCEVLVRLSANSNFLSQAESLNDPRGNSRTIPNGNFISGEESFAIQVALEEEDLIESFATSIAIATECGTSYTCVFHHPNLVLFRIPQETARYLTTKVLSLPIKVYDLFSTNIGNSVNSGNESLRFRSFSVSSASSDISSSRFQTNLSAIDSVDDEVFLKFDESDDEIDVGTKEAPMASEPVRQQSFVAISVDPSTLTLIPAANVTESLMWMTTIDGVFVYITWIGENIIKIPSFTSQSPSGAVNFHLPTGNGLPILRRVDSGMVNASQLLNAGGLTTEREGSVVLSLERFKKRHRHHTSALRGTWIPLSRARELARTLSLDNRLRMFLTDEAGALWFAGVMPSPMRVAKKKTAGSVSVIASPTGISATVGSADDSLAVLSVRKSNKVFVRARKQLIQAQEMVFPASVSGEGQRNIYPPGSLAAVKYAMAQRAAAMQAAEESLKHVAATDHIASDCEKMITKSEFVETDNASPGELGAKSEPRCETKGENLDSADSAPLPSAAKSDTIAATESATRTAITTLANALAQQIRTNTSFTPPIIAATLAALATGTKKINDAVRADAFKANDAAKLKAPTAAAILQAFANSMAVICINPVKATPGHRRPVGVRSTHVGEDADVEPWSITDGQFRPANLAGVSAHVLAQLRASIETAARTLLRNKSAAIATTTVTSQGAVKLTAAKTFAASLTVIAAVETSPERALPDPSVLAPLPPSLNAQLPRDYGEQSQKVGSQGDANPLPQMPRPCLGGRGKSALPYGSSGGKIRPSHLPVSDRSDAISSSSSEDDESRSGVNPGPGFTGAKKQPVTTRKMAKAEISAVSNTGMRRTILPPAARPLIAVKAPRVSAPVVIQAVSEEDEEDIDILN